MRIQTFLTFLLLVVSVAKAQRTKVPYFENFDSAVVPALPAGWVTTTNRSAGGDFVTTRSAPFSDSNAVISTNATVTQALTSPLLDFSGMEADSLTFLERRSSTHNSGLIVEASTDGGATFTLRIADTLSNPGTTSYVRRALKLPADIDNQLQVRFRWRIVGNGTGSTGTLRFDDIGMTGRGQIDASVTAIHFFPRFPLDGDSVMILATVRNAGTQPLQNIPVEFYEDQNNDSLTQPGELLATRVISSVMNPRDTIAAEALIVHISLSQHLYIVRTAMSGDQNPANDVRTALLSVGLALHSVVINEIMYAPPAGEPEWIELTNTTARPIDLQAWKISNRNSQTRYLLSSSALDVLPGRFVVITKDSALLKSVHPDSGLDVLQVSSLPTFLFNNTGDAVVLFDSRGAVMDSVHYVPQWGGLNGSSLERIEAAAGSDDSTNWGSSVDSLMSTPGRANSLTPFDYDLRVLCVFAVNASNPGTLQLVARVQNAGKNTADDFTVAFYEDANNDSLVQDSELIQSVHQTIPLQPKESTDVQFSWTTSSFGMRFLIARIDYPQDMRPFDNKKIGTIRISYPSHSLIINEIMYAPTVGDAEYVELFNPTSSSVNLRDWRLSDQADTGTSATHRVSSGPLTIAPGSYFVVAGDSAIFQRFPHLKDTSFHVIIKRSVLSLNNDGDDIILFDLTRLAIDSVHYFSSWQNRAIDDPAGRSLERINPNLSSNDDRNWSTSADPLGGTPGRRNSLYAVSFPTDALLSFAPNPFSPDGNGFEDVTIISYKVPSAAGLIRMRIYDSVGRLVRTLADGEPTGSSGELVWNGMSDRGERVRMGIYIVLLDGLDGISSDVFSIKAVVVVASRL